MRSIALLVPLIVSIALRASSADGVLEIRQTCASQTGCFRGDAAGLPVRMEESGSNRLTSNLEVSIGSTSGILIADADVRADLAGLELRGPVACGGKPMACTPNVGQGSRVEVTSSQASGISVDNNGSIRGMRNAGVAVGVQSEVMDARTSPKRFDGITAFTGSTISGNTAYQNGGDGVGGLTRVNVFGNTIYSNAGFGLDLGSQSSHRENGIAGNAVGEVTGKVLVELGNNACDLVTTCP